MSIHLVTAANNLKVCIDYKLINIQIFMPNMGHQYLVLIFLYISSVYRYVLLSQKAFVSMGINRH